MPYTFVQSSRFACDPEFQVVTRQGVTLGTIVTMPVPVRGPNDSIYIVPLNRQFRWDRVAEDMTGDPLNRWIVMRHNRIPDGFLGPKAGDRLLIPTQAQVAYYKNQGSAASATS